MEINEDQLFDCLGRTKSALLVEPLYRRKYPPLGLCKISGFIKRNGGRTSYCRRILRPGFFDDKYDFIFITSLFTYNSDIVLNTVRAARRYYPADRIIVGGVYASLMTEHLVGNTDVLVFPGFSKKLDMSVPDFSLNRFLKEPWCDFSYVFTTRGCPNKCAYCAVWRVESSDIWVNPNWKESVVDYLPNVLLSDNNLSAAPMEHVREVTGYLAGKGKKVLMDNGLDCKRITLEMAREFGKLRYVDCGMRVAFDRIEEDGVFQEAVKLLIEGGVPRSRILAFVLFNFMDTPQEAYYRMKECKKLGIRFYPEVYRPLNMLSLRDPYVGRHWTPKLVKLFRYYWMPLTRMRKSIEEYMREECDLDEGDWEAWHAKRD